MALSSEVIPIVEGVHVHLRPINQRRVKRTQEFAPHQGNHSHSAFLGKLKQGFARNSEKSLATVQR